MRDIRERTLDFALRIIKLCQQLDKEQGVARTLGWQLLRSGTSIGANVEEAQAGQSKLDFISKNAIALKEARETIYWVAISRRFQCNSKRSPISTSRRGGRTGSNNRCDHCLCEEREEINAQHQSKVLVRF